MCIEARFFVWTEVSFRHRGDMPARRPAPQVGCAIGNLFGAAGFGVVDSGELPMPLSGVGTELPPTPFAPPGVSELADGVDPGV